MKTKPFLKVSLTVLAFSFAFVGVKVSSVKTNNAARGYTIVSLISLGSKSMAYCNEALYSGEHNWGVCSGAFNGSESRCNIPTTYDDFIWNINCVS
ncbi:MAG TPA: hypothetical protein VKB19_00180 [Pedobacter sp.]|nr:hypothetical protein [Pedobacter sp.]